MLLKKRKHLEMMQLLFASVAVKARRAAVNLMNGDAYAESTSVTAEQTSAFDSADHVQVQRGGCYVGRPHLNCTRDDLLGQLFCISSMVFLFSGGWLPSEMSSRPPVIFSGLTNDSAPDPAVVRAPALTQAQSLILKEQEMHVTMLIVPWGQ